MTELELLKARNLVLSQLLGENMNQNIELRAQIYVLTHPPKEVLSEEKPQEQPL